MTGEAMRRSWEGAMIGNHVGVRTSAARVGRGSTTLRQRRDARTRIVDSPKRFRQSCAKRSAAALGRSCNSLEHIVDHSSVLQLVWRAVLEEIIGACLEVLPHVLHHLATLNHQRPNDLEANVVIVDASEGVLTAFPSPRARHRGSRIRQVIGAHTGGGIDELIDARVAVDHHDER